jgi:hypothetical protein
MRCSFATPLVGNAVLADLVEVAGWKDYFMTFVLPGAAGWLPHACP